VSTCSIEGIDAAVLENKVLRVTVLAGKGAEVVELLHKPTDVDVLWRGPGGIVNPASGVASSASPAGAFMDFYNGGWQEFFPTLGAPTSYYGAPMGEHGEVVLLPWEVAIERDDSEAVSASFTVRCRRSPFRLRRTLALHGSTSQTLVVTEEALNEAGEGLELMWGHHPVLGEPFLEPGCTIALPGGRVQAMGERDGRFAPRGTPTVWPRYVRPDGSEVDLSQVGPSSCDQLDELYVGDPPEGRHEVCNRRLGVAFELAWDIDVLRYLWWWRGLGPAGGYPWYSRTFMLGWNALSSVPPDFASAQRQGTTLRLGPGEARACRLAATVRALARDDGGRGGGASA